MLAYTGTVKILDFGIARAASFAEEEAKKGLIKGKVSYLSPSRSVRPAVRRPGRRVRAGRGVPRDADRAAPLPGQERHRQDAAAAGCTHRTTVGDERDHPARARPDRDARASIDVTQRFQSVADMASDLERTLIAARYSSRELSKLLHGLFLPDEDPVVVVDTDDHRTVAMTGTTPGSSSGTSGGGSNPTATGTATGVRTPSLRSTSPSMSISASASHSPRARRERARHQRASAPLRHQTPSPSRSRLASPRPRELLRPADSGTERLERVVQAERGRLARKRMRGKLRIVGAIAGILRVRPGRRRVHRRLGLAPLRARAAGAAAPAPQAGGTGSASQPDDARAGGQAEEVTPFPPQRGARDLPRRRRAVRVAGARRPAAAPLSRAVKTVVDVDD